MPPLPGLPHFTAEGEARDRAVAGRRAVARGSVRPQAGSGGDARAADSGLRARQGPALHHDRGAEDATRSCRPSSRSSSTANAGMWLSEMLPHTGSIADDICLVNSMHTEAVNHAPGVTFFMTGSQIPGRPSMGAWATYGLGSMTSDLPAFCVMTSTDQRQDVRPAVLRLLLGQRLPAVEVSGRAVPRRGRSGPLPRQPGRHVARACAAACWTTSPN